MGICWYCHWGWPKPVADIYSRACVALGDEDGHALHYGPAHIVWEDENFGSAEWCLEHFDEYSENLSDTEKTVVRQSLVELVALPLDVRDVEPEDYDDEHPALFPPPADVVMVKV